MESSKKEFPEKEVFVVKSYVPHKEIDDQQQEKLNELIYSHPKSREYLTHKEYVKIFASEQKKSKDLLDYAKSKKWKAEHNKETRELTIKIFSNKETDEKASNEEILSPISFLNAEGDVHLDIQNFSKNTEKATAEELGAPVHRTGFVKQNTEKRIRGSQPIAIQESNHGHSVLEIANAYNFPEGDGEGQTIGIIELGGEFKQSDLETFFAEYKVPVPEIEIVGTPSKTPENENIEVTADIQVAGLLAPKSKLVIYYGTSILEAMKSALSDSKNQLSTISISWAGSELNYSQAEINELNYIFYEAALKGITVVGASGDYGAFNNKSFANVNVPVNFPFVLGCGGTTMQMDHTSLTGEIVWNESTPGMGIGTGGGFSQRITQPSYQKIASQKYINTHPQYAPYHQYGGRSVPDIAANAANVSGYTIYYNGEWKKIGGTSLATPLWASLIALINQGLGYKLGFVNALLYKLIGSNVFRPIVQGNNNLYVGALDWNPCTGLGSPDGKRLLEVIKTLE